ncbi:DNA-processing protein DprA [Luteimicrobium subarcticum]|uniref:DNA processing protein n=1 Tax=Luteimicrobium subarcticum TaxID=620910 RepID=A0A2M8WU64_9MICO|nr:DNA-processing protein DprA [Luteimicrobium subarcticum]PJI94429.1 DNA processing protein [Luteimicrobium subarcticum]
MPDVLHLACAAWARLAEPGDTAAGAIVRVLGPVDGLVWARAAARGPDEAARAARTLSGDRPDLGIGPVALGRAVARWAPRVPGLDAERDLEATRRLGARFVVPADADWPGGLDDLGDATPRGLWLRGDPAAVHGLSRSVALVGARACTDYGSHVAADLAHGAASQGVVVVSGGAYGIDAAAHRGALAAGAPTVAFLAGGVDRLYPAGNADLLRAVLTDGLVIGELPPGGVPTRVRFLQRNRLIAAASSGTVVVEAAWRSGALSTAAHAQSLLRPVGAVPGPVTSMASGGCHRLLRDGGAVCVTDADEVVELVGRVGGDLAPWPAGAARETDALDAVGRRLFDALPLRRAATVTVVARDAGLALDETLGGLGLLEVAGFAERSGDGWRRRPGTSARDGAPS